MKRKIHFNGYDNNNRPIIMVYGANHNPKESSLEMLIKFACFIIETAVKKYLLLYFFYLSYLGIYFFFLFIG